uniref:C2h2-type zn-finger protein n=1 Tax=Culex tarsalis TaxID=7177 RepID=A0A1Q3G0Y9_CULTA
MEVIDMNIEYDLARICRCCRREAPNLQPIFTAVVCGGITLYEMLTSCTQAQVNFNDGLPENLCEECVTDINTAYGFRKRYEQSDILLREYLSRRKVEPDAGGDVKVELFDVKPDIAYIEQPDPLVGQEQAQQQQELLVVETVPEGEDDLMTVEFVDESGDEDVDYEVGSLDEMIEELEELKPRRGRKSNGYSRIKGGKFACDSCDRVFTDRRGISNHVKQHDPKEVKQCPLCSREFTSSYHLNRHIKMHENDTDCEVCGTKFALYHDYKDHMAVEHPGVALVEPKKTEKSERELALTLTAELLEEPGKMEAICRICDATFERIAQLRAHLRTHEDPKSFENVNIANKPYLFEEGYVLENYLEYLVQQVCKGNLLRFYQIVEPDGDELELSDSDSEQEQPEEEVVRREHSCGLCQQSFPRIKLLREHARGHRPEELIGCKHCARGFPSAALFMRHLRQQCENTAKKFHCTFCNEKFMWQTSLNKHAQSKHKPTKPLFERPGEESGTSAAATNEETSKKFVCQVCSKGFQRLEHLERHIKIHIPSEKKFECPVCHKKFNRKDNLRSHLKIHQKDPEDADAAGKQNQLCVYCGRGFSNSSNLIVHMRRHTGERPYRCDICDKGFPRSSDLQCHRRTHTGEKPCLCTICGKGFSRSNKLVRHMRIHTGARPYSCTYCDRAFTQSNDLTLHIRRHTGEKPYICGVCNERFIQGTALKAHQRATGHFDDGTAQPERFASISVNNPNRMGINGPKAVRQSAPGADGTKPVKVVKSRKKAAPKTTAMVVVPTAAPSEPTEEQLASNLTAVVVAPPAPPPVSLPQTPLGGGYVPTVSSYIMQNYDLTAGGLFSQSFNQQ